MLEYDSADLFEGIDVIKTIGLYECIICQYWYFLTINFRSQPKVFYSFHELMQKALNLMMLQLFLLK